MRKTVKSMVDEATAAITTYSIEEARDLHGREDVQFIDIRDVRELERDGVIPGAFHAPRGMLEFWACPESPVPQAGVQRRQAPGAVLRRRLALGAGDQDAAGHGRAEGRAHRRRLHGLEGGRRAGGRQAVEAGEAREAQERLTRIERR